MSSGRVHQDFNIIIFMLILAAYIYYMNKLESILYLDLLIFFTYGFLFGTYLLSPDLDMYRTLPHKNWRLLRILWIPYTAFFSHRGISHIYIIGSFTRQIYLALITYLICISTNTTGPLFNILEILTKNFKEILTSFEIGILVADSFHIWKDNNK